MKTQNADKDVVKGAKKPLQVLQAAAGDKENLVGSGRLHPSGNDSLKNTRNEFEKHTLISEMIEQNVSKSSAKRKKLTSRSIQTEKDKLLVDMDDLTSDAGPSENYWEVIAEKRRVTLEEALHENEVLHNRIEILEKEKAVTEAMLAEAKNMVEVLSEIIDENSSEGTDEANDST